MRSFHRDLRTLALAAGLLAASSGVVAKWEQVSSSETSTTYADKETLRRTGKSFKIWLLYDLTTPQRHSNGQKFQSAALKMEFDCQEERVRSISSAYYSGHRGTGDSVGSSDNPKEWVSYPPGSTGAHIAKLFC